MIIALFLSTFSAAKHFPILSFPHRPGNVEHCQPAVNAGFPTANRTFYLEYASEYKLE
jgi:hypothetical protein